MLHRLTSSLGTITDGRRVLLYSGINTNLYQVYSLSQHFYIKLSINKIVVQLFMGSKGFIVLQTYVNSILRADIKLNLIKLHLYSNIPFFTCLTIG
jgi:hypothetical protein